VLANPIQGPNPRTKRGLSVQIAYPQQKEITGEKGNSIQGAMEEAQEV
jgi:hypothetical protein